jgi:FkbM family methyltransferase
MPYPRRALLALPFTRLELPGWGPIARSLAAIVPAGSRAWGGAPVKRIRGKAHGYWMELHLDDWAERLTYFLGRYYEDHLQRLLAAVLGPGERFVDVGGNIGMITLLGASAVGRAGEVQTFEPNPACLERLRSVLELNRIDWVEVIPLGLSDRAEELVLSVVSRDTGVGTFAPLEAGEHEITSRMSLRLACGDSILLANRKPVRLIKIDVEGFETRAIRGLTRLIARDRPLIVTEVVDQQLRRAGASAAELFDQMHALGYEGHAIGMVRRRLRRRLRLRRARTEAECRDVNDVLWMRPEDRAASALLETYGG